MNDTINNREMNPMTALPFGANTAGPMTNTMGRNYCQPQLQQAPPAEFSFEYNFDENGALYYLGSSGRSRLWQNPHSLG